MFSRRTQWDRSTNRLAQALHARRESGAALVDLTESNPTVAGLACPAELLQALAAAGARTYAPDPRGLLLAREASAAARARSSTVWAAATPGNIADRESRVRNRGFMSGPRLWCASHGPRETGLPPGIHRIRAGGAETPPGLRRW